jgi:hypothetical protein
MRAAHPFSETEVRVLGIVHFALIGGVAAFAAITVLLNAPNRGIGPGVIPDHVRALAWGNIPLPLAALIFSRLYLPGRISKAYARLRDRKIHIEQFKRRVRAAYLVRAAVTEFPALLGLVTVLLVVLHPGDIFAAPPFFQAGYLGAMLFMGETLLVLPTEGRLQAAFRAHNPD